MHPDQCENQETLLCCHVFKIYHRRHCFLFAHRATCPLRGLPPCPLPLHVRIASPITQSPWVTPRLYDLQKPVPRARSSWSFAPASLGRLHLRISSLAPRGLLDCCLGRSLRTRLLLRKRILQSLLPSCTLLQQHLQISVVEW